MTSEIEKPVAAVVAIDMGYGHLRAALPLAQLLNVPLLHADKAPLAGEREQKAWARVRRLYETTSRLSQLGAGGLFEALLNRVTSIRPLYPQRDMSRPNHGARYLARAIRGGVGKGLAEYLNRQGVPLLSTYFGPALAADWRGVENNYCVVTDSDINRAWVPASPRATRIQYLAPSLQAVKRLICYGVPEKNIELTGFPLPHPLLGGRDLLVLRKNLARRLVRLDPSRSFRSAYGDDLVRRLGGPLPEEEEGRPPLVVFAVGGAGAQVSVGDALVRSFAQSLTRGKIRLALIAGIRPEVFEKLRRAVAREGLDSLLGSSIHILFANDFETYFEMMNALLAETDILWTKPSELTFYAALGIPLVFSRPVGAHEFENRRWAVEKGAGLRQLDPRFASEWIADWLADGTLAAAAWAGFMSLPKLGTYRILEAVTGM